MILKVMKVSGQSLEPAFREGDFVLVSKIPFLFSKIHPGDAIVFRHPLYGTLIKIVDEVSPDGEQLFVIGLHAASTDSRLFGPIAAKEVLGKVIAHIRQPR
jgi:signal peptidase I